MLKTQDQPGSPYSSVRAGATLVTDVFDRLRQLGCGHTEVFRFEPNRMWLECLKCGRQSPGLVTTKSATVRTVNQTILRPIPERTPPIEPRIAVERPNDTALLPPVFKQSVRPRLGWIRSAVR